MVICYSATGNSMHAALKIQQAFQGDLIDVCDCRRPSAFRLADGETLFFVTFNCFWGVSARMEAFIRENEFENVRKTAAILTCGGYLGGADASFERLLLKKGLPKPVVHSLPMVTNHSVLHDIPPKEVQREKLLLAETALEGILRGTRPPYRSSRFVRGITPLVHALYKKARSTSPFRVGSACVRCGLCAKNCPVHAIKMEEEGPYWQPPKCDGCLRCLNRCPAEAIDYGPFTRGRLRYSYESCRTEGDETNSSGKGAV